MLRKSSQRVYGNHSALYFCIVFFDMSSGIDGVDFWERFSPRPEIQERTCDSIVPAEEDVSWEYSGPCLGGAKSRTSKVEEISRSVLHGCCCQVAQVAKTPGMELCFICLLWPFERL